MSAVATVAERALVLDAIDVRSILAGDKERLCVPVTAQATPAAESGPSPFGRPGDRLWVRETWRREGDRLCYRADDPPDGAGRSGPWSSPMHMPRDAARLVLEVASVTRCRLQDLDDAAARAHGILRYEDGLGYGTGWPDSDLDVAPTPIEAFARRWDAVYGAGAWAANAEVWEVVFRRT